MCVTFNRLSVATLVNNGAFARDQDHIYALCSYDGNKKMDTLEVLTQAKTTSSYHTFLRIRARAFLDGDFASLEVIYRGDSKSGASVQWKNAVNLLDMGRKPLKILPDLLTEPNFFFDFTRRMFTIVYLEVSHSAISVCRSSTVEGPYECIKSTPVRPDSVNRIAYAAKAHPELNHPTEEGLVVSYMTNTAKDPSDLFQDGDAMNIYVPQFVNILNTPPRHANLTTSTKSRSKKKIRKRKSGRSGYENNI